MLLGPLFRVEMVSVARRSRYFVLRAVYGLLALFLLWIAYASSNLFWSRGSDTISHQQGAALAAQFFASFCWLQILAILGVGPALAVGTIATERERRTIEYLFTTDLSNAEIILGKLVARLCLFGQLLVVGMPILFLFRLLGGIPAQLLVVTFLFAATTSMMIAALSICVSVWSERTRDATVRVYLLLGVLTFLPIILHSTAGWGPFRGAWWNALGRPVVDYCISINPIWSMITAMGSQNSLGAGLDMVLVWQTLSRQVLVSVLATGLAIFAVRRVHLKETTKAAGNERRRRRWRLPRWRRPLKDDPMIWKELFAATAATRLGFVGRVSTALILATVCVFTWMAFSQTVLQGNPTWYFLEYLNGFTAFIGTGILLLLAARAAGLVTSEKERDCWTSLLATPLTGREIIRSKMWGNLYSVRWPALVLAGNWALGVSIDGGFIVPASLLVAVFALLAWYVTNLGLCFSLQSQTTLRAMGAALGTLVFTGGGYLFCCCVVMAGSGGPGEGALVILAGCIPFLTMFPILGYLDVTQTSSWTEEGMFVAYSLGILGYLMAAGLLYLYLTTNFDRLSGRTDTVPERLAHGGADP